SLGQDGGGTVWNRLAQTRKLLQEPPARRGVSHTAVLVVVAVGANDTSAALSPSLVVSTAKAAVQMVAGRTLVCGLVSASDLTLVKGGHRAMFLIKCKTAFRLISCGTILGAYLALPSLRQASAEPPKEPQPPAEKAAASVSGETEKPRPEPGLYEVSLKDG